MDGSSDWSGRGSRSRDSSTCMSRSDKKEQFAHKKSKMQKERVRMFKNLKVCQKFISKKFNKKGRK